MVILVGFYFLHYLFVSYCIYLIAQKFETIDKWRSWIPIINLLVICEIVERPGYYVLLMFIPFINIFIWAELWMDIAGGLGRDRRLGILAIIPILNFIVMGYLAISDQPSDWHRP